MSRENDDSPPANSSRQRLAISLKRVAVAAIVDLRHEILRKGLPREAAIFEGDEDQSSLHWGAFSDDRLVGCVTLHASRWDNEPAWQLRGMAVANDRQKAGVGRALLGAIDEYVAQVKSPSVLWCNARVPAAGFYQKHGWKVASDVFEIPTAGPHVRMVKRCAKFVE